MFNSNKNPLLSYKLILELLLVYLKTLRTAHSTPREPTLDLLDTCVVVARNTLNTLKMSVAGNRNPTPSAAGSTINRPPTSNSNDRSDKTRVSKPDLYHGERSGLEDWLSQLEVYFMFDPLQEEKKTMLAVSYLRGRAQHWFKPTLRKFLDDQEDDDDLFAQFSNFKKEIRRVFGETNEEMAAVRIIQHLKQRTSASEYTARFEEYSQLTEWNDEALMTMYRRGLKDNVKDELMRDGRVIDSMDELTKAAIEIDNKLYERAMEKRYDGGNQGRAGFIPDRPIGNFRKGGNRFGNGNANRDQYGPAPMELDSTERKPRKGTTRRGKQGNKKDKTCYGCGKPGHFARDCRSKVQRQLNVLTRCDEPDGWDMVEGLDDRAPGDYDADSESEPESCTMTESEIQSWEEAQSGQVEARKDRVQRTNPSELRELTPYPRGVCTTERRPSHERTRSQDIPDKMRLGWILESNTIENVTDAIEQSIGSSANIEKLVPEKLQIRGKELKVEISSNGDDSSASDWDRPLNCRFDDYVDCYQDVCEKHVFEKMRYLHFPRNPNHHNDHTADGPTCCDDRFCLYHYGDKVRMGQDQWKTGEYEQVYQTVWCPPCPDNIPARLWMFINLAWQNKTQGNDKTRA